MQVGWAPGWGGRSQKHRAGKDAGAEGQVPLAAGPCPDSGWQAPCKTAAGFLSTWQGRGPEPQGEAQSEELLSAGFDQSSVSVNIVQVATLGSPRPGLRRGPALGTHVGRAQCDHCHSSGCFLCTGLTCVAGASGSPAPSATSGPWQRPTQWVPAVDAPPSVLCPPCCQGACVGVSLPRRMHQAGLSPARWAQPSLPAAVEAGQVEGQCQSRVSHRVSWHLGNSPALPPRRLKTSFTRICAQKLPPSPWKGRTKGKGCVCMCV